ncbi:fibronectin type III domain-containing protein [Marinobacter sp. M1N3S26]|uniref:fibronectin type III domain-containing protein n=1 Tax=unclassified Marinobacter TaxID=83889 RepID=UPI00387B73D2
MQFNVTGKSRAGIAAVVFAVLLTGCGGSGGGSSSEASTVQGQAVSLSWQAPGQRINGEQISLYDIDAYIVRYGRDPDKLDQQAVVDGCTSPQCVYDVQGLAPGTWYFAVQTKDVNGLVSLPSEPVSRTI